jgi:hypothetical protein
MPSSESGKIVLFNQIKYILQLNQYTCQGMIMGWMTPHFHSISVFILPSRLLVFSSCTKHINNTIYCRA